MHTRKLRVALTAALFAPLLAVGTPSQTTSAAAANGRPVVFADANTVLDQPNTIYDFRFGSPGEVVILASNVEARNIRGGGARRIGARDGRDITDSGFRNFEFTFANIRLGDGGRVTRPYFIDGTDVNPQPHVADGDIIQIFAYEGDIIDPLIDNVTVYGKKLPAGSDAHNDGIQFTGIAGGEVWNPTIRNSHIEGASSAGVQAKHVHGVFTIENTTLSERFQSFHAVIAKPGDKNAQLLWRNNTLLDGASAAFGDGWKTHPASIAQSGVTIDGKSICAGRTCASGGGGQMSAELAAAVAWMSRTGITTEGSHFAVDDTASRGHAVTFLYRAEGEPRVGSVLPPDVGPFRFYADPVAWALKTGVITGFPDGTFRPDRAVSRGQFAVILFRAAGSPSTPLASIVDVDNTQYYAEAIAWARKVGVMNGYGNGRFGPDDAITRGQVALMMCRYSDVVGLDVASCT